MLELKNVEESTYLVSCVDCHLRDLFYGRFVSVKHEEKTRPVMDLGCVVQCQGLCSVVKKLCKDFVSLREQTKILPHHGGEKITYVSLCFSSSDYFRLCMSVIKWTSFSLICLPLTISRCQKRREPPTNLHTSRRRCQIHHDLKVQRRLFWRDLLCSS